MAETAAVSDPMLLGSPDSVCQASAPCIDAWPTQSTQAIYAQRSALDKAQPVGGGSIRVGRGLFVVDDAPCFFGGGLCFRFLKASG